MEVVRQKSSLNIPTPHQEVLEEEWKMSENGILTTRGVQPCTLIALYEPESSTGYLGHFAINTTPATALKDMLEIATINHPQARLEAWVGGAALIDISKPSGVRRKNEEIYNEMVSASRGNVVAALQTIDCELYQDWLQAEGSVLDLVFNTNDGTIMYSA
jgi:hypothetical protein